MVRPWYWPALCLSICFDRRRRRRPPPPAPVPRLTALCPRGRLAASRRLLAGVCSQAVPMGRPSGAVSLDCRASQSSGSTASTLHEKKTGNEVCMWALARFSGASFPCGRFAARPLNASFTDSRFVAPAGAFGQADYWLRPLPSVYRQRNKLGMSFTSGVSIPSRPFGYDQV